MDLLLSNLIAYKALMIPFRVAHCINCGAQAQVTDFQGKPVNGIPGSKIIFITLGDDSGVKTRIGSVPVCKDCRIEDLKPSELIENLLASPHGLLETDPELKLFLRRGIEVVKTYEA